MKAGLIGWRGMVGSVLLQRMQEENDFDLIEPVFFSTSRAGTRGPAIGRSAQTVQDALKAKGADAKYEITAAGTDATVTADKARRVEIAYLRG